jgi:hypothetical protein
VRAWPGRPPRQVQVCGRHTLRENLVAAVGLELFRHVDNEQLPDLTTRTKRMKRTTRSFMGQNRVQN